MAGRVLGRRAAALLFHLTCVSAVQRLNSINDLRTTQFGHSIPRYSLRLLHWFANRVDPGHAGIGLNFNPDSDYGSHHYGNRDGLLPQSTAGYRYYTVGNVNEDGAEQLPDYVRHQQYDNDGCNRARIIFRVRRQTIERVYLTQHFGSNLSAYDPNHTYEISTDLLRELRQLPRGHLEHYSTGTSSQTQISRTSHARNTFPAAAGQSQGPGSISDMVQWAFVLIVAVTVFILIVVNVKSLH